MNERTVVNTCHARRVYVAAADQHGNLQLAVQAAAVTLSDGTPPRMLPAGAATVADVTAGGFTLQVCTPCDFSSLQRGKYIHPNCAHVYAVKVMGAV